jgi:hypothetical protein
VMAELASCARFRGRVREYLGEMGFRGLERGLIIILRIWNSTPTQNFQVANILLYDDLRDLQATTSHALYLSTLRVLSTISNSIHTTSKLRLGRDTNYIHNYCRKAYYFDKEFTQSTNNNTSHHISAHSQYGLPLLQTPLRLRLRASYASDTTQQATRLQRWVFRWRIRIHWRRRRVLWR